MATAQPVSRDPALEAHALWYKFRGEIAAFVVVVILGIIALGVYKLYTDRRDSSAADLLAAAKNAPDYEQVIAQYPNTPAGASAHLLLAEAQRKDRKLVENATLEVFIDKNPKHELVSTAEMGIASNLEAMGKTDEALSSYQRIAAKYPTSFTAPLALISQVSLLKAKNQPDAARRVCETILTQYRESFWAGEAMRELRSLKPAGGAQATGASGAKPAVVPPLLRPPMMLPPAPAPAPSGAPAASAKPK